VDQSPSSAERRRLRYSELQPEVGNLEEGNPATAVFDALF